MDEPASALDPGSTSKVEELMVELKENYTVVLVTHNMQQAARVGTNVAFLYKGDLVEFGPANEVFENPKSPLTEKYIRGTCSDARSPWDLSRPRGMGTAPAAGGPG